MANSAVSGNISLPYPAGPESPRNHLTGRRGANFADLLLHTLATGAALTVLGMLAALILVLIFSAMPSIQAFGTHFLTGSTWRPPTESSSPLRDANGNVQRDEEGNTLMEKVERPAVFAALPVIYGTAVSSGLSLLFAIPLSFGAALFMVRIAPRARLQWVGSSGRRRSLQLMASVSFLIEFLAAIPSIAYGIWGIFVLIPFLQKYLEPWLRTVLGHLWGFHHFFYDADGQALALTGHDMFCGGLILSIMIIPIITALSRDILKAVPSAQIEGTQALGATWWQSSWEMLRYSRSGLFGAIMLGLARAAGETMAVAMVIGNVMQIHASPFEPAQTMASLLANKFREASDPLQSSALIEVALILLMMSLLFNIVARYLVVGKQTRAGAGH